VRIEQWHISAVGLDPVVGSEQGKTRPCLIVSATEINYLVHTVVILPITSRKEGRSVYPNDVFLPAKEGGLPNDSIILVHQIRTVDKRRLSRLYGSLSNNTIIAQIFAALDFELGR
jgi:mRNA interferase MazF